MIGVERIAELIRNGEGLGVEFKRCSGAIEHDVFVIERDRMFVENACRASSGELITPSNLEPDPKNPVIAAFFREIAYADQLGSGVKNLYKYAKAYGGDDPTFQDGDRFRISVSLERLRDLIVESKESGIVSPEIGTRRPEVDTVGAEVAQKRPEVAQKRPEVAQKLQGKGRTDAIENALAVFDVIANDPKSSIAEIEIKTNLSNGSVKNALRLLRLNGIVVRQGGDRGGEWRIIA